MVWGVCVGRSCPEELEASGEEREVPGQRKVVTMISLPSCFSPASPHNLA